MTDFTPDPAKQPDMAVQITAAIVRHGLTVLAGVLAEHGILTSDQQTQFISLGLALAMGGASLAWSFIQKHGAKKALNAAVKS